MINFHGYGHRLFEGALLTAELAVFALILALIIGLIAASAKLSRIRLLRFLALLYTSTIRSVPPLVLLMLSFYGGQLILYIATSKLNSLIGTDIQINIDAFMAGVITLGVIFGAYMCETFRGAFLAVEGGQLEAARAYGMTVGQVFFRVHFPQMMHHALPGINNNWLVLLKSTALVSIIGLSDMVWVASQATKSMHAPFLFMVPVALGYLAMASISELVVVWLQRRYDIGFYSG